jgi:hypothetical protein
MGTGGPGISNKKLQRDSLFRATDNLNQNVPSIARVAAGAFGFNFSTVLRQSFLCATCHLTFVIGMQRDTFLSKTRFHCSLPR